jgi:outer membrane protein W
MSSFGIGADVGIKYDMTDFCYISGGLTVSYLFTNYTTLYASKKTSNAESTQTRIINERVKGYSLWGIKPYIGIGFNYYQEGGVWGKPKK